MIPVVKQIERTIRHDKTYYTLVCLLAEFILIGAIYASAYIFSAMNMGMMFGYPAFLIPALLSESGDDIKANKDQVSWIASTAGIGGIFAVFAVGPLMHYWGRKWTNFTLSILISLGWILTSIAPSILALVAGRAFQGFVIGSIYFYSICIAEYTCPSIRGVLLNMKLLSMCLGTLFIHAMGYLLHWRFLALIPIVPLLLSIFITTISPESPAWLVSRGRFEEAELVFFNIRGHDLESVKEIRKLIETEKIRIQLSKGILLVNHFKNLRSKSFWRPILLLCLLKILPEAGGKHFIPTYSLQLVEEITGDKSRGFSYTIILDIISVFAALVSNYFVKIYDRRHLILYFGCSATFLLVLACLLMFIRTHYLLSGLLTSLPITLLLSLYYFIMCSTSFGVCFVIIGEFMPLEFRTVAVIIDGILSCVLLAVILKLFPILNDLVGLHGTFLVFALIMLISMIYMNFDMPETKDRTLQDISEYFEGKSPKVRHDETKDSGNIDERRAIALNCE